MKPHHVEFQVEVTRVAETEGDKSDYSGPIKEFPHEIKEHCSRIHDASPIVTIYQQRGRFLPPFLSVERLAILMAEINLSIDQFVKQNPGLKVTVTKEIAYIDNSVNRWLLSPDRLTQQDS